MSGQGSTASRKARKHSSQLDQPSQQLSSLLWSKSASQDVSWNRSGKYGQAPPHMNRHGNENEKRVRSNRFSHQAPDSQRSFPSDPAYGGTTPHGQWLPQQAHVSFGQGERAYGPSPGESASTWNRWPSHDINYSDAHNVAAPHLPYNYRTPRGFKGKERAFPDQRIAHDYLQQGQSHQNFSEGVPQSTQNFRHGRRTLGSQSNPPTTRQECRNAGPIDTWIPYTHCSCPDCDDRNRSVHLRVSAGHGLAPLELQGRLKQGLTRCFDNVEGIFPLANSPRTSSSPCFIVR